MPDSRKRPPLTVADDLIDPDEAPVSEPRPSSPAPDASLLGTPAPSNDADAPLPPDDPPAPPADSPASADAPALPVTRALTNAFLQKKTTQARIREVVEARVPKGTQAADIEDLIQEANVRAASTTALARSVTTMRAWASRLTQNIVIDHFKANAKHLKWLDRSVEVQELPPDPAAEGDEGEVPADDPTAPPRPVEEMDARMLGRWVDANVKTKADLATLEMLKEKAKTGKTNAELATEYGISVGAYDQRVQRFKAKWVPAWNEHKKEQRDRLRTILWLVAAAVAAAMLLAWFLWPRTRDEARPTDVPVLRPVPTASASAGPAPFNQADPTEPAPRKAPEPLRRDKP